MKKILCLFLVVVSVFTCIIPVYAADESDGGKINTIYDISNSSISDDFRYAFNGEYSLDDFPLDVENYIEVEDNIFLIDCIDFNYSDKEKFEMYFYIYNPTKKDIDVNYDKNYITFISNVTGSTLYKKHPLEFVSSENDGVILKFKVTEWLGNLISGLSKRHYKMSELELRTVGEANATSYSVSREYIFTDNALGYTTQQYLDAVTVETEVNHTYYRYQGDTVNNYIDLRSVYFNIPNEVIKTYGSMKNIIAEWEECQMYPILVTNDKEVSDYFSEVALTELPGDFAGSFGYDKGNFSYEGWRLGFNAKVHGFLVGKSYNMLGASFYQKSWESEEELITADELMTYINDKDGWKNSSFKSIDSSNYGTGAKEFGVSESPLPNAYIVPKYTLSLWAHELFRIKLKEDNNHPDTYTPLTSVDPADFILSDEKFSEKYLVNPEDVTKIKNSNKAGYTTFILQYTVTDYRVFNDVDFLYMPDGMSRTADAFVAESVAIRNFDVIQAEYDKDGVKTIIPFIADPTNAVTGVTSPYKPDPFADFMLFLQRVLTVLVICLVVYMALTIYNSFRKKKYERTKK